LTDFRTPVALPVAREPRNSIRFPQVFVCFPPHPSTRPTSPGAPAYGIRSAEVWGLEGKLERYTALL